MTDKVHFEIGLQLMININILLKPYSVSIQVFSALFKYHGSGQKTYFYVNLCFSEK